MDVTRIRELEALCREAGTPLYFKVYRDGDRAGATIGAALVGDELAGEITAVEVHIQLAERRAPAEAGFLPGRASTDPYDVERRQMRADEAARR